MKFTEKYQNETVRALSWKQPFASLMLHGKIETRVWDSKYRGWVLICASKQPYSLKQIQQISGIGQLHRIMESLPLGMMNQRFGVAIAVGKLAYSQTMLSAVDEYIGPDKSLVIKSIENDCFVKYHPELWMHTYEDVQPIVPFDWKGKQGWCTLNDEQLNKIELL